MSIEDSHHAKLLPVTKLPIPFDSCSPTSAHPKIKHDGSFVWFAECDSMVVISREGGDVSVMVAAARPSILCKLHVTVVLINTVTHARVGCFLR